MTETIKGYTIEIEQDEFASNPRTDWDNAGKMYCSHRRYDLGDVQLPCPSEERLDLQEEMENVRESEADIFLPLFLYDHSGITISTARTYPYNDPWDSGCVGFIHLPASKIRSEYSVKRISKKIRERAVALLRLEVETYDQYLTGDVWNVNITQDGEFIDQCGGFFGYEYAEEQAKEMLAATRKQYARELCADRKLEREAREFVATAFAL